MRNGQTLIRYYKGQATTTELLEEVLETHLIEDMGNTRHGLGWYADNLRHLQDFLHQSGYMKKGKELLADGEVTQSKIIEAMSMLAKGDVLARANELNIPQWLKDFLMMVRQWVSSAKALLDLGNGLHELEARRKAGENVPVDEDFIQYVHELSGSVGQYWFQEGVEQGETQARSIVDSVSDSEFSASLMEENGDFLAPNGKPSNLPPELYKRVRTPEFKNWFGDWEKVARFKSAAEKIMNMDSVVSISGQEFQKDGIPLTEKVTKFWKERFNGIAVSPELGEVRLDIEGVKSSIGHGIGSLKSAAFACVEDVIRNGIVFDRQENWKGRGYDTAVIAAPVTINEVEYICEVVVEQRPKRQGFYLHEVEIKKKLEDVFKTSTEGGTPQASRSILALRAEEVKTIEENMSKVVDENGEPLPVYHGTWDSFTRFKRGMLGRGGGVSESRSYVGHWFSVEKIKGAKVYMPVFLNIRNPHEVSFLESLDSEISNGNYSTAASTQKKLGSGFAKKMREDGEDGVIVEYDREVGGTSYVVLDSNQVKSSENNQGTFDPNNPDITQSITEDLGNLAKSTIDRISPLKVVGMLTKEIDSDLATWGRYNGETDQEQFYSALGRNMTLMKTALMFLPIGKRGRIKPTIDRIQILTELATTGRIDETADVNSAARREIKRGASSAVDENREDMEVTAGIASTVAGRAADRTPIKKVFNQSMRDQIDEAKRAWAEGKLKDLIETTLKEATAKLNELACEDIRRDIQDMLVSVLKVKVKKGVSQKGKISFEAYTYLEDHVLPLLNMTTEAKEVEINEITAAIEKIEKENPDQIDDATQAELDDLKDNLVRVELYGNIQGMDVAQLSILSDQLRDYIRKEREAWKSTATAKREARKAVFRKIVATFNSSGKKVNENTLREANEEYKRTWSALKNLPDFVENMDNLLNRLENITGIKDFMKAMRSRQTEAFTAMWADKDQRGKDVQAIYDKILTDKVLKKNKMKNQVAWVTWFKESHQTDIKLVGTIRQNVTVSIETARELRDMDEKGRATWASGRFETGKEYISMTTIDEIISKLNKYEEEIEAKKAEGKHPRVRSHISAMTEYDAMETPPLVLSRDNALYIILQCEQPGT